MIDRPISPTDDFQWDQWDPTTPTTLSEWDRWDSRMRRVYIRERVSLHVELRAQEQSLVSLL